MKRELLDQLRRARESRRPVVLLTWLESGAQRLWAAGADGTDLPPAIDAAAALALRDDRSTVVQSDTGNVFLHAHLPAPRLLVVGAVHIAQVLAPMAALAGFDVTVIDPRRGFASEQRFGAALLDRRWPDEALRALAPDARSAVVTLSHDPKLDDAALHVALESDAFYIAALGSTRTHASRVARLREAGAADSALARIHGPAGLDIGAIGSAEIAVSVLAQAIAALRRRDPQT